MGNDVRSESNEARRDRELTTAPAVDATVSARLDELFSVLSNRRRRRVLYSLVDSEDAVVECSQLVRRLADGPVTIGASEDDGSSEASVARDLYHVHLPRLEDAGIVEYDRRQGTVRYDGLPFREEWLEHAHYTETGQLL